MPPSIPPASKESNTRAIVSTMMMSKPAPESAKEERPPAFAVAAKKTPQSAAEDLERRLAMLGDAAADPAVVPGQRQALFFTVQKCE
jgi:hypothetical protein